MSVQCIRKVARFVACGVLVGFFALIVFGLTREPVHYHLWFGALLTAVVWGFVGAYELIVRSQPATKAIVAHTLRALEEEREAAEAAHLPRLADRRR